MRRLISALVAALVISTPVASASGYIGIYGIVEKVVFEPSEQSPERIQVWGAFAYVDGGTEAPVDVSEAKRGYLYFKLPDPMLGIIPPPQVIVIKREWADLKSVAGTGQAVGFGSWGYIGRFDMLRPASSPNPPAVILERVTGGGRSVDLRIRPANEPPTGPATYQTNVGIVRVSEQGSHAAVVKQLKAALANR